MSHIIVVIKLILYFNQERLLLATHFPIRHHKIIYHGGNDSMTPAGRWFPPWWCLFAGGGDYGGSVGDYRWTSLDRWSLVPSVNGMESCCPCLFAEGCKEYKHFTINFKGSFLFLQINVYRWICYVTKDMSTKQCSECAIGWVPRWNILRTPAIVVLCSVLGLDWTSSLVIMCITFVCYQCKPAACLSTFLFFFFLSVTLKFWLSCFHVFVFLLLFLPRPSIINNPPGSQYRPQGYSGKRLLQVWLLTPQIKGSYRCDY